MATDEAHKRNDQALAWQAGIWDRISETYLQEVDKRFTPVIEQVILRAGLEPGERVLDLGTGTGAAAIQAAGAVGPGGHVTGTDISADMLAIASRRATELGLSSVTFEESSAEAMSANDSSFDVVLASLSMMYVIDREAAARECARVLSPAGRFVAAVWSGANLCDIVLFQQTAGQFAPPPPVTGVGPGSLADPAAFLGQLAAAGLDASVETEALGFDFADFETAWDVLAGVTTAALDEDGRAEAKAAVQAAMWPDGDSPRHFRNVTQFIVGSKRG